LRGRLCGLGRWVVGWNYCGKRGLWSVEDGWLMNGVDGLMLELRCDEIGRQ